MTQESSAPLTDGSPFRVLATQDTKIREFSRRAAQVAQPRYPELERRSQPRVAYPRLITLTPLGDDLQLPNDSPIHVVGKHLSALGLDFFHHDPIPQRYAVASLETGPDHWLHFLMKITWCRFLKANWYDSGGRFLKVIEWSDDNFVNYLRNPELQANQTIFSTAACKNRLGLQCMD